MYMFTVNCCFTEDLILFVNIVLGRQVVGLVPLVPATKTCSFKEEKKTRKI